MTKRMIDTDIWSDEWFEGLVPVSKLLFIYLVTSPYTSRAGIGQATDRKITNDIGLTRQQITDGFKNLSDKVIRDCAWFWIKNFYAHQAFNLVVKKSALTDAKKTPFFDAFIKYNEIVEDELTKTKQKNQYSNKDNITGQVRSGKVIPQNDAIIPQNDAIIPEQVGITNSSKQTNFKHDKIIRALGRTAPLSQKELDVAEKLFVVGCTIADIESARKRLGKNNLAYLQNPICEDRDKRTGSDEPDYEAMARAKYNL